MKTNIQNKSSQFEHIYNVIVTIIIAFAIIFIIYVSVPYLHYNLYLVETIKQGKLNKL